jgi:integrase/recombinase XerD
VRDEAKVPSESRFFWAALRRNAMEHSRDLVSLKLPRWGRVAASPAEVVPYLTLDEVGNPVEPIRAFLRDFVACGNRRPSVRPYCYALLRWWRFLLAVDVAWDQAGPAEGRDYVLWLSQADKPIAGRRTRSAATAGRVNHGPSGVLPQVVRLLTARAG